MVHTKSGTGSVDKADPSETALRQRHELGQLSIVKRSKGSEKSQPLFVEVTRHTLCDVVTLVTTINIEKNGFLKYVKAGKLPAFSVFELIF